MAILNTIAKGIKVTQAVAVNAVPQVEVVHGTLEKLDQVQGIQWTKMLVKLEKRSALLVTRLMWPQGVVHGKSSGCLCPVS